MSNLDTIVQSIKSEVKVDAQGKGSLSKRGLSRLLNVHMQNLVTSNMAVALVQELTQFGFDPDKFNENGIPDVALGLIANYYAYESKAANPQAKAVAKFLAATGARVVLQQIAGYVEDKPKDPMLAFEELVTIARQYTGATAKLPKLDDNLSGYYNDSTALPAASMTYKEYIQDKGIELSVPQRSDFTTRLSHWCRTNDKPPTKIVRKGQKYNAYDSKHFPFMDTLLEEVLETSYKPSRKAEAMFSEIKRKAQELI